MADADRGSGSGVWTAARRVVTVLLAVALVTATVPVGSVVGGESGESAAATERPAPPVSSPSAAPVTTGASGPDDATATGGASAVSDTAVASGASAVSDTAVAGRTTAVAESSIRRGARETVVETNRTYRDIRRQTLNPETWRQAAEGSGEKAVKQVFVPDLSGTAIDALTKVLEKMGTKTHGAILLDVIPASVYSVNAERYRTRADIISEARPRQLRDRIRALERNAKRIERQTDVTGDGAYTEADARQLYSERLSLLRSAHREMVAFDRRAFRQRTRTPHLRRFQNLEYGHLRSALEQLRFLLWRDYKLTNSWLKNRAATNSLRRATEASLPVRSLSPTVTGSPEVGTISSRNDYALYALRIDDKRAGDGRHLYVDVDWEGDDSKLNTYLRKGERPSPDDPTSQFETESSGRGDYRLDENGQTGLAAGETYYLLVESPSSTTYSVDVKSVKGFSSRDVEVSLVDRWSPEPYPEPVVKSVETRRSGGETTVSVTVSNRGGPADWQSLAVSLPTVGDADRVTVTDHDLASAPTTYGPGSEVGARYGSEKTTLSGTLVEGAATDWQNGETHTVELRVDGPVTEDLPVRVKSAARADGTWLYAPSATDADAVDQQGEYVVERTVQGGDGGDDGDNGGDEDGSRDPPDDGGPGPTVNGPTEALATVPQTFTVTTARSEGPEVYYEFQWGDGTTSRFPDSTGTVRQSVEPTVTHAWASPGEYTVRVRAVTADGEQTAWAERTVTVREATVSENVYAGRHVGFKINTSAEPPYHTLSVGGYDLKFVKVVNDEVRVDVSAGSQTVARSRQLEVGERETLDGGRLSLLLAGSDMFSDQGAVFLYATTRTDPSVVGVEPSEVTVARGETARLQFTYPPLGSPDEGVCAPEGLATGEAADWLSDEPDWINDAGEAFDGNYRELELECDEMDGKATLRFDVPEDAPLGEASFDIVIDTGKEESYRVNNVTLNVKRGNEPPSAPTLSSPSDGAADIPTNATLSWRGSDPDGDSLTYEVYLEAGDRTPDEVVTTTDATSVSPSLAPGTTYYWQVVARDGAGGERRGPVWSFTTAAPQPTARFETTPQSPVAGQTVRFDAGASSAPDGQIDRYEWDFDGDGRPDATGRTVQTTFERAGDRPVTLTVVSGDARQSTTRRVAVAPDTTPPSVLRFDATPSGDGDAVVTVETDERLAALAVETDAGRRVERGQFTESGTGPYTYTATVPARPGETATVRLVRARDDASNDAAKGQTVSVDIPPANRPPSVSVDSNTSTVASGGTVFVSAADTTDPDGDTLEYRWRTDSASAVAFADASAAATAVRLPTVDTDRQITLTVTVDDGAATRTAAVTVLVRGQEAKPTARLSVPGTVRAGEQVTLNAAGSTDPDGEIVEYRFDTDGDGQPETTTDRPTTTVTYDEAGTYTPRVTVVDDDGTERTATATVTVEQAAQAPTATRELPDGVQPGERVTVTVRVPVDGEVNGLAVDEESPLPVVDQETAPQASYRSDERQWLFVSVTDRTAVVNYTVQVPDDAAPGTQYTFAGEVSATDTTNATVGGDTALVVRRCPASAVAGDDDRIELREIQRAIGAWADSEPVAGEVLDLRTVQRLIGLWADSERAACAG